jgi:hypothetical protein
MPFRPRWTEEADSKFRELQAAAAASLLNRQKNRKAKAARAEGLFKQIEKCVRLLLDNPVEPQWCSLVAVQVSGRRPRKADFVRHLSGLDLPRFSGQVILLLDDRI